MEKEKQDVLNNEYYFDVAEDMMITTEVTTFLKRNFANSTHAIISAYFVQFEVLFFILIYIFKSFHYNLIPRIRI